MKNHLFLSLLTAFIPVCLFSQPLTGTYTIDFSSPTGGTNYNSFTDAVGEVVARGVGGPVVFEVASGTYVEQVSIGVITGASLINTITFRAASGDSTDVIWEFPSSATIGNNYLIEINAADYLLFQSLTLSRTGTSNYARVIDLVGNASFNRVERCVISGVEGSTSSNGALIYSGDNTLANTSNTFHDNRFLDGHAGVWYEGGGTGTLKPGLTVTDNVFETFRYGIYLRYLQSITLTGNEIFNATVFNSVQSKGIYCFHCDNALTISHNKVVLTQSTNNYAIELAASIGTSGTEGIVTNNMLVVGGTGTVQGITSGSLTAYKLYAHNSVQNTGGNPTSSRSYYQNGSNNIRILNNVFSNEGGGYAMQVLSPTSGVLISDYNDLYVLGVNVGNWGGSNTVALADWQATSLWDTNSVSLNPLFTSATDLHAAAPGIENAATSLPEVTDDFDGQPRDPVNPDMGCDEIGPLPCTLSGSLAVTPSSCPTKADGAVDLTVSGGVPLIFYVWSDGSTTQDLPAVLPGEYVVTVTDGGGCTLIDSATVSSTYSTPVVDLGPDVTICDGDSVVLDAGSGFVSYAWSDFTSGATTFGSAPGTYFVQVADSNTCVGGDTVEILAHPPSGVGFTALPIGLNVALTGLPVSAMSFNWDLGDGNSSSLPSLAQTHAVPGVYEVCLEIVDMNGCSDVFCDSVNISLTGNTLLQPEQVTFQSFKNGLRVSVPSISTGKILMQVWSVSGKRVGEKTLAGVGGEWTLSGLASGVYWVRIKAGEEILMRKVVCW